MQIAAKSKIAKIVSGILATVSIAVIARIVVPIIWFWIGFEVSAALLVAIGCAGEWYLHHHPSGRKKVEREEHHKLESRFIAAVVIGVFMEFLALGHAIPAAMKLEVDVASANERAGTATNMAAQAIEKAAKFDLARAQAELAKSEAEKETALIQSNNLELQKQLQPRMITAKQTKDFMFLTEKITSKIPITVHAYSQGDDTMSYAIQIRLMLDAAGFPRDPNEYEVKSDTGVKIDIGSSHTTFITRIMGDTNEWPNVIFVAYSTNGVIPGQ